MIRPSKTGTAKVSFLFIKTFMTLKQSLIPKTLDALFITIISISLINSVVSPSLVKAAEAAPVAPVAVETEVEAVPVKVVVPVKYTKLVVATAYSSEAAQTDSTPCIPAMWKFDLCEYFAKTGIEDTIAANFLPLGTKVRFPEMYGDKVFVVRDRMNAKYNGKSRIDFWMSSKPAAVTFGVKRMVMEVL